MKYIYFYNIVIIIAILKIFYFLKYLIKYLRAYNLFKLLQMLLMKSLTWRAFLLTYKNVEIAAWMPDSPSNYSVFSNTQDKLCVCRMMSYVPWWSVIDCFWFCNARLSCQLFLHKFQIENTYCCFKSYHTHFCPNGSSDQIQVFHLLIMQITINQDITVLLLLVSWRQAFLG